MSDQESKEWIVIRTVEDVLAGELIEGFLRNQDIPCEAESLYASELPTHVAGLSEVKIRVPEDRAEEALAILAKRESQAAEEADESDPAKDDPEA